MINQDVDLASRRWLQAVDRKFMILYPARRFMFWSLMQASVTPAKLTNSNKHVNALTRE